MSEGGKRRLFQLSKENCEISVSVKIPVYLCVPYKPEVSLPSNGFAKISLWMSSVSLGLKKKSVTPKTLPQCTSTESNLRDRILSEVKKNTVIALPGKGGQNRFMPSKLCVPRTWVVVQSLRLHLPMQGMRVQSVVRELRFHMPHGQRTRT